MICGQCKVECPTDSRFCANCASPLTRPSSVAPPAPETERRNITVLFCDVVGSTELSARLDPEEMGRVLHAYHEATLMVVRAHGGHVAQFLGDGLLAYFDYPITREDGAARALRAALRILDAIRELNPRLRDVHGADLEVRVGVHTGPVVFSAYGDESHLERLAVGETPNLTARVQAAAAPGQVVATEATWRLAGRSFHGRDLGPLSLRGVSHPVRLYEVLSEVEASIRPSSHPESQPPIVGREAEQARLAQRWAEAAEGPATPTLLLGEAGIGKSRQVQALRELVTTGAGEVIEVLCVDGADGTALHPLTQAVRRRVGASGALTFSEGLDALRRSGDVDALDDDALQALAGLITTSGAAPERLSALPPAKLRQSVFDALLRWVAGVAAGSRVLLVVEDVHWADPSTVEFLGTLLAARPAGVCAVLCARNGFAPPWPAEQFSVITLERLTESEARDVVNGVTRGREAPPELVDQIVARGEGVPLYLEELTRAVLESDRVRLSRDRLEFIGQVRDLIPATLHDSLMARLDRLGPALALAQLAATLGREFHVSVLRELGLFDDDGLRRELGRLRDAGIARRHGDDDDLYVFKHALVRDAAYQSLLHSTQQRYHSQILRVLVDRSPTLAEYQPELLAQHYAGAGIVGEAAEHWRRAGQVANAKAAFVEAAGHFRKALDTLARLSPSRERDRREIEALTGLGLSLISTQGFASAEVEATYARAAELCAVSEEVPFSVLLGVWSVVLVRGDHDGVERVVERMRRVADSETDDVVQLVAHASLGSRAYYRGELDAARDHCARSVARLAGRPARALLQSLLAYGTEALLYGHFYGALADAAMGRVESARAACAQAVALAEETAHPYMLALAFGFGAAVACETRDPESALELSARALEIAAQNGLVFWLAVGKVIHGWALAHLGRADEGLVEIDEGLATVRAIGTTVVVPHHCGYRAEALLLAGRIDEGLAAIDEGLAFAAKSLAAERTPPELLRLRGALLRRRGDVEGAEVSLRRSLALAKSAGAAQVALRAATEFATLLAAAGRGDEARDALASSLREVDDVAWGIDGAAAEHAARAVGLSAWGGRRGQAEAPVGVDLEASEGSDVDAGGVAAPREAADWHPGHKRSLDRDRDVDRPDLGAAPVSREA